MAKGQTDTCECGRPEIGPRHCPVHGDGKAPVAPETPREPRGHKAGRVVKPRPAR
jgi:hypothetical protein